MDERTLVNGQQLLVLLRDGVKLLCFLRRRRERLLAHNYPH